MEIYYNTSQIYSQTNKKLQLWLGLELPSDALLHVRLTLPRDAPAAEPGVARVTDIGCSQLVLFQHCIEAHQHFLPDAAAGTLEFAWGWIPEISIDHVLCHDGCLGLAFVQVVQAVSDKIIRSEQSIIFLLFEYFLFLILLFFGLNRCLKT